MINIANSLDDGICIINQTYEIAFANRALEKAFGAWHGKKCYNYFHGREEVCLWCKNKEVFEGKTIKREWYSEKSQKTYELMDTPLKNSDDTVLKLEFFRDVTDRKKMENELRDTLDASHRRQSEISALLSASRAVLQHREFKNSARIIFNSCKELLGARSGYVALLSKDGKENEVLFLDAGELPCTVNPSLPMPIRGLRNEAYTKGQVVYHNDFANTKWARLLPKGHVALKNILFAPLVMNNKTVGIIGLANKPEEFTEHDAKMALAFGEIASIALLNSQTLENLEAIVEERTKKLKDSERLATIGQVAGMVGHDIRNPLQAITSDVYLAKCDMSSFPDGEDKKSVLESIEGIGSNVEYINKIVADLQDIARPLNPVAQETDLQEVCEEVLLKNEVPENIRASFSIDENARVLLADSTMLKRVISNLVSNAIQAMPNGGALALLAHLESSGVAISVQDTGEGVPEDIRPKLFTPLFTTKSKGQGFGLAVVKRLTEAMGGTVTFESEIGRGTKFIIRLPSKNK